MPLHSIKATHGPSFSETFFRLAREAHEYRLSVEERQQEEKLGREVFQELQREWSKTGGYMPFWEWVEENYRG